MVQWDLTLFYMGGAGRDANPRLPNVSFHPRLGCSRYTPQTAPLQAEKGATLGARRGVAGVDTHRGLLTYQEANNVKC